jgi:hypothetical protein
VVQFKLQGVPGHSAVSARVEFGSLKASAGQFKRLQLAGRGGAAAGSQQGASKRRRSP